MASDDLRDMHRVLKFRSADAVLMDESGQAEAANAATGHAVGTSGGPAPVAETVTPSTRPHAAATDEANGEDDVILVSDSDDTTDEPAPACAPTPVLVTPIRKLFLTPRTRLALMPFSPVDLIQEEFAQSFDGMSSPIDMLAGEPALLMIILTYLPVCEGKHSRWTLASVRGVSRLFWHAVRSKVVNRYIYHLRWKL
jgi:hypothetical protein